MEYKLTFEDGSDGYLEHFGVKGMHWGVWNDETRARRLGLRSQRKGSSGVVKSKESKEDFYTKCLNAGYSKKQAMEMANGREVLKKVAIGTAVVAGVAAAGVIGYHIASQYGTRTIKAGKIIQTVHDASQAVEDRVKGPFYATYTKADNAIYGSKMFGHFKDSSVISQVAAKQDIKIASEGKAREVFSQMVKDNPRIKYKQFYTPDGREVPALYKMLPAFEHDLKTGRIKEREAVMNFTDFLRMECKIDPREHLTKTDYRRFNYELVKRGGAHEQVREKFFGELKKKGFGAVIDSNDAFREAGGWTFRPLIVFGDVKYDVGKQTLASSITSGEHTIRVAKASVATLTRRKLNRSLASQSEIGYLAAVGAGTSAMLGVQSHNVNARMNFIESYKKEHPGTKMTNAQLGKMYDKNSVL